MNLSSYKFLFFSIALMLISSSILHAQTFQFFPNNARAVYYLDDPDNCFGGYCLKGYRVDSISGNTSFSYREASAKDILPGNCLISTNVVPWLGDRVAYTSNGFNLVINEIGDTLRTFIHPSNGTSWTFYNLGNGEYIRATQESQYFKQYVGRHDDTKRVRLHKMNLAGDTLPSPWNGAIIEYSFNFSIYNFPNVNTFPDDTSMYYIYGLQRIIPGTSASVDSLIPDTPDFFEFKMGQEWHYTINQRSTNDALETVFTSIKRKKLLMDKEWNADSTAISLTYWKVDVVWEEAGSPPDENSQAYNTFSDTIQKEIILSNYDYLNRMPDEFYPNGHYGPGYVRWFAEGDWNGRIQKRLYEGWEYDENNNCLSPDAQIDGQIERIFVDKIGLVYAEIPGEDADFEFYEEELVFYQRGLEDWGTAIDFHQYHDVVSTNDIQASNPQTIEVYPNPVHSSLNIRLNEKSYTNAQLKIIDFSGRSLINKNFSEVEDFQIDLNSLPSGVYLLEIKGVDNHPFRKRIIKL